MFMVLKVLAGLFTSPALCLITVYSTETVSEKYRTEGSLVIWIAYAIGNFILALTSYLTQNWRKVMVYNSIPYGAVAVMIL